MTMPDDVQAYNMRLIEKFRADGGASMGDRPLLLLTTTGARSRQPRTRPLMYVRHGDRLVVIASANGAPRHPDWFHNLRAHPEVTVEVAGDTYQAVAEPLTGEDFERTWAALVRDYPFFVDHRARAGRDIPLVALTRLRSST